MHHGMQNANGLQSLGDDMLQQSKPLGVSLSGQWMQDEFPLFKGQVLIGGKALIRLLYAGMQPVTQRGDKGFAVGGKSHLPAIRLKLLGILPPRNQLLAIVRVLITPLDVEITRFEVPEQLRKNGNLEVSPQDFVGTTLALALSGHKLPPGVRGP